MHGPASPSCQHGRQLRPCPACGWNLVLCPDMVCLETAPKASHALPRAVSLSTWCLAGVWGTMFASVVGDPEYLRTWVALLLHSLRPFSATELPGCWFSGILGENSSVRDSPWNVPCPRRPWAQCQAQVLWRGPLRSPSCSGALELCLPASLYSCAPSLHCMTRPQAVASLLLVLLGFSTVIWKTGGAVLLAGMQEARRRWVAVSGSEQQAYS